MQVGIPAHLRRRLERLQLRVGDVLGHVGDRRHGVQHLRQGVVLVVEDQPGELGRRGAEELADRRLVDPQADGVGQDETLDALGIERGELHRDPAAERGTDHRHRAEPERAQQVDVVEDHVEDAVDLVDAGRLGEAGMRGEMHREPPGEPIVRLEPLHVGPDAVQVEERRPVAPDQETHVLRPHPYRAALGYRRLLRGCEAIAPGTVMPPSRGAGP